MIIDHLIHLAIAVAAVPIWEYFLRAPYYRLIERLRERRVWGRLFPRGELLIEKSAQHNEDGRPVFREADVNTERELCKVFPQGLRPVKTSGAPSLIAPATHLLVIGSTKHTQLSPQIQGSYDLAYQYLLEYYQADPPQELLKIVSRYGEEYISSEDTEVGTLGDGIDYGFIFIARLPHGKRLYWISGIHGHGTVGVADYFMKHPAEFELNWAEADLAGRQWLLRIHYDPQQSEDFPAIRRVDRVGGPEVCPPHHQATSIKAVLFDFGNVLMSFDRYRTYRAIAHTYGKKYEDVALDIGKSGLLDQYEKGDLDSRQFYEAVRSKIGVEDLMPFEAFSEWWGDIFWENRSVIKAVRSLQGKARLLLVSNTNPLHFDSIKEHYPDVVSLFDELVLSYRKRASKSPDGQLIRMALDAAGTGVRPDECLYVDDIGSHVRSAQSLGMKGILYRSYPRFVRDLRSVGLYVS